jgi:hypothetical protein
MALDDAIREHGFRRWYERQLYESHAWLVTGLLAIIMMAVALEVLEFRRTAGDFALFAVIAVAGGALCLYAWRRFNVQLFRAEHLAGHATCAGCGAYAKFAVVASRDAPDAVFGCALDVRCRRCGHGWTLE